MRPSQATRSTASPRRRARCGTTLAVAASIRDAVAGSTVGRRRPGDDRLEHAGERAGATRAARAGRCRRGCARRGRRAARGPLERVGARQRRTRRDGRAAVERVEVHARSRACRARRTYGSCRRGDGHRERRGDARAADASSIDERRRVVGLDVVRAAQVGVGSPRRRPGDAAPAIASAVATAWASGFVTAPSATTAVRRRTGGPAQALRRQYCSDRDQSPTAPTCSRSPSDARCQRGRAPPRRPRCRATGSRPAPTRPASAAAFTSPLVLGDRGDRRLLEQHMERRAARACSAARRASGSAC